MYFKISDPIILTIIKNTNKEQYTSLCLLHKKKNFHDPVPPPGRNLDKNV